jgi:uncharacterized protein (DUF885 family)
MLSDRMSAPQRGIAADTLRAMRWPTTTEPTTEPRSETTTGAARPLGSRMLAALSRTTLAVLAALAAPAAAGASTAALQAETAAPVPAPAVCADESARFDAIAADYDAFRLTVYPEYALQRGIKDRAGEWTDTSLAGVHKRAAQVVEFVGLLREVDPARLSERDRTDHALLLRELELSDEGFRFGSWMMPVGGRSGPHQQIAQLADFGSFATFADYDAFVNKILGARGMVLGTIEVMRRGLEEGVVPPKVTVVQVPAQVGAVRRSLRETLGRPFRSIPASIGEAKRAELRARFERGLDETDSALTELEAFLLADYIPACRETVGARDLKAGDGAAGLAWYGYQLRLHTTTDRSAEAIHATGLAEVARIRAEMMQVIARTDWHAADPARAALSEDARFSAFIAYLRSDPRFYVASAEELLARYREVCKRIDPKLPALFKTLPRLTYGVREIPRFMAPAQTTAYYQPGSPQRGEPGWFYANTYALDQRPTYEFVPLSLHEAVPGHHFQIALAQELDGLREFRKDLDSTAFVEGWALYAERLGIEMGLFTDPYDDFGRLLYEMWRATRLVVDTGLHAFGWSREQAIDYMKANTALSEINIVNEVDRYIGWPGQACAYKIGELEIRAMRAKAEAELGRAFDIRAFHDAVLLEGPLPLDVLWRNIDAWIAREKARAVNG